MVPQLVVRYGVAVASQILIFPAFGLHLSLGKNLSMAGLFTAISICRSFTLQRQFQAILVRRVKSTPEI
jgi:hypothetical protein